MMLQAIKEKGYLKFQKLAIVMAFILEVVEALRYKPEGCEFQT
jgi:hypothetical protein